MTDRDLGIQTLRKWYLASGMQFDGVTFEDALSHYDTASPTFVSGLGGAVRVGHVSDGKVQTAMENLGAKGWKKYPFHGAFFDALAGEVLTFRYEDAKEVAAATVNDIKKVAVVGTSIYLMALGIGAAVLLSGALAPRRV